MFKAEYIEKIYAGWLAKVIGVRLGAPIEGWGYWRIKETFGELWDYPQAYKQFAADDDTNGPLFFLRALEDCKNGYDMKAQDVGEALLNYACFEKGFFWWGGYGRSTEHTAYLNLRAGIPAPRSGSIAQNGSTVAEQIGGQIFIDTWGLVTPGNPDLAAKYAREAASVTHDGNGIYGGIFIATCISHAFVEHNIHAIIEKGLSYIPTDCEYTRVVRAVMAFYEEHPDNWRDCYIYISKNFGYDKYPGNCHIIPNSAVMILSLLYGEGDFSKTINICNMCGWDTDCNVGNIATIMGVRCGLEEIDDEKWRKPINDILICSGVLGSLNIMDVPYGASYIAKLAAAVAGEELPQPWKDIIERKPDGCHFEYPGSTHGMRLRAENDEAMDCVLQNTDEAAHTGTRSLKVTVAELVNGKAFLYKKTYYKPQDFDDSRYDPSFSPVCYPGQTISAGLRLTEQGSDCKARAYVRMARSGEVVLADEAYALTRDSWAEISYQIPFMDGVVIEEAGFVLEKAEENAAPLEVFLDDFIIEGAPDYTVDFAKAWDERWMNGRFEISQFTRMKGLTYLEKDRLHLTCSDFGETYTGSIDWTDYQAAFSLRPECGSCHMANVRVQGAIRSYAAGFGKEGVFGIYKNDNGYTALAETAFDWQQDMEYEVTIVAKGNTLTAFVNGDQLLAVTDTQYPYMYGSIGVAVREGSHMSLSKIKVQPVK